MCVCVCVCARARVRAVSRTHLIGLASSTLCSPLSASTLPPSGITPTSPAIPGPFTTAPSFTPSSANVIAPALIWGGAAPQYAFPSFARCPLIQS